MTKLQIIRAMSLFGQIENCKSLIRDAKEEIDRIRIQRAKTVQLFWENDIRTGGHINLLGAYAQPLFESAITLLKEEISNCYQELANMGVDDLEEE